MTAIYGYDLNGADLVSGPKSNITACCTWCLTYSGCTAFTWGLPWAGSNVNVCFLKHNGYTLTTNGNYFSAHY